MNSYYFMVVKKIASHLVTVRFAAIN